MAIDETTGAEGEEEDTKGGETILPGSEQTAAATSTIIAEKAWAPAAAGAGAATTVTRT